MKIDLKTIFSRPVAGSLAAMALILTAGVATSGHALASPSPTTATAVEAGTLEAGRKAILGMAGTFHVNFDFRETVSWRADYTPIDPKISGGFEVVRVIEDSGRVIKLQHILVVGEKGEVAIVKHWRQDWTYEPAEYLEYRGRGTWAMQTIPEGHRKGVWSQTVWQTDDSPRYGGVGRWELDMGVPRWTSRPSWRPLARRDAVRHPVYDRYLGVNRHARRLGPYPGQYEDRRKGRSADRHRAGNGDQQL